MNPDTIVPYKPVSEERKLELESILREGNLLLKNYHEMMKENQKIHKHNRTSFLNDIATNYVLGEDLSINGISIPEKDAQKISRVKEIEEEVICAYANLINKIAQRWSREGSDVSLSSEDLKGEAYQAALDAIAHFTDDVRLSTFLHHCIHRHMSRLSRLRNGLSNLSDGVAKLKAEYSALLMEEGATFESVVEKMNIDEKEVQVLQSAMSTVKNVSSFDKDDKTTICFADDYEEPEFDNDIGKVISSIEFSELERAVLDGVLNSPNTRLGIGSISKQLVNPETNKPYSRMAFSLAWKRVKKKIIDAYGKAA